MGKARDRSYKILADRFESLDYDIARSFMDEFISGPVFSMFYGGKIKGEFPVAVLSDVDKAALGTRAQTVWFSQTSLNEHKKAHPEVRLEDYQKIPEIVETGEVYKQKDTRLIYLKEDGKLYRAALKRTRDKKENFYLTLFETDPGRADRQIRRKLERVR